jgi:hypothetical protein
MQLSTIGPDLLHFVFKTLLSLLEVSASVELQKESPTIMSAGEMRSRRMRYYIFGDSKLYSARER